MSPALVAVIALIIASSYLIGLRDAANSVSTTITTRTLRESTALRVAALLTVLGALLGLSLLGALNAYGTDLLVRANFSIPDAALEPTLALRLVAAALLAHLVWGGILWWAGHPTSSWHVLLSALAGATAMLGIPQLLWAKVLWVLTSTLLSIALASVVSYTLMHLVAWLRMRDALDGPRMRFAQTISACSMAAAQGINNIRMPAGAAALLLASGALPTGSALPVSLGATVAMGAGVLVGGHRIIRTVGRRITNLSTAQGLTAETTAATMTLGAAMLLGAPVSSSQLTVSSVIGSGAAVSLRNVRWAPTLRVIVQFFLTPVPAGLLGALFAVLLARLAELA